MRPSFEVTIFESVCTNIPVTGYAARNMNELVAAFLKRSFAHIAHPVLPTKSCKHEVCVVEKVRLRLDLIGLIVMGNGHLSSQCVLLIARYSRDEISGELSDTHNERSSWRIARIKRNLSGQPVPCLMEAGPY